MYIKNPKSKIKYGYMLLAICTALFIVGCGGKQTPKPTATPLKPESIQPPVQKTAETTAVTKKTEGEEMKTGKYLIISVKSGGKAMGKIKIELYPKDAPKTVANIIKLTNQGFFNGLTFHRIISGFMIQGGDPKGDGTGGPDYTIPAEFSPKLTHIRGAVAMARTDNPTKASSSCQFYICHGEPHHLDGNYTIFGQVVEGMNVVDAIASVATNPNNNRPIIPVVMSKVTLE